MIDTTRETKKYYILRFVISLLIAILAGGILYLTIISNIVPLVVLSFIFLALCMVPFAFKIRDIILVFYYIRKIYEHHSEVLGSGKVIIYDGAPGSGKTLSMSYDSVLLANSNWNDLRLEYFLRQGRFKKPNGITEDYFDDYDDYWVYKTVEETFNYYCNNPDKVPLLISNYPIKVDEQYSAVLKNEHFLQEERLPEKSSVAFDECADFLTNKRSGMRKGDKADENIIIDEFLSKERHFGDFNISCAEQDSKEAYLGLRRVVLVNRYLEVLSKVLEPKRLMKRYDKIRDKIFKNSDCSYLQYLKITKLKSKINKIGFFKIFYSDYGNSQKKQQILNQSFFILPKHLPFEYKTRSFRFQYRPLQKDIDLETFDSLYL